VHYTEKETRRETEPENRAAKIMCAQNECKRAARVYNLIQPEKYKINFRSLLHQRQNCITIFKLESKKEKDKKDRKLIEIACFCLLNFT